MGGRAAIFVCTGAGNIPQLLALDSHRRVSRHILHARVPYLSPKPSPCIPVRGEGGGGLGEIAHGSAVCVCVGVGVGGWVGAGVGCFTASPSWTSALQPALGKWAHTCRL